MHPAATRTRFPSRRFALSGPAAVLALCCACGCRKAPDHREKKAEGQKGRLNRARPGVRPGTRLGARPGVRPGTRPGAPALRPVSRAEVARAVRTGIQALCRFPEKDLRHDTAVGLAHVLRLVRLDTTGLQPCLERIKQRGLRDQDHPLNPLIDPAYREKVDLSHLRKLPVPGPGQKRTNVNHMVFRAAHCRWVRFPDNALVYVTGPMRDQGGFHSCHALWVLLMLREQGCRKPDELKPAIDTLCKELLAAQSKGIDLNSTPGVDLYAERLLFLARAGVGAGADPDPLEPFVARLLQARRPDGCFAAPSENEPRWLVHSTTVSVWALSQFLTARRKPDPRSK